MPDAALARGAAAVHSRRAVLALFGGLIACAVVVVAREARTPLAHALLAMLLLVPLALPLPGLLRNDRRTFAWATLCLTPHSVYALTEIVANPTMRAYAIALLVLAFAALVALVAHLRLTPQVRG
jgi:uncharacterized membrane protein